MTQKSTLPKAKQKTQQKGTIKETNLPGLNILQENQAVKLATATKTTPKTQSFERERVGLTKLGMPVKSACQSWLKYRLDVRANVAGSLNILAFIGIPGLDSDLCRCADCLAQHDRGLYWVDEQMRDRLLSRA